MGWSWGTVLMGRYASQHKDRVHRLVLYAPVWLHDPPTQGSLPPLGAYRTPNGIYADDREFWTAGKPAWDPSEITSPTLVIVGDWDGVTPASRAQAVFGKLANAPERRLVQIGEATHIVLLEKNRRQLYREVQAFLDE